MLFSLENGTPLKGDLVFRSIIRNDLSPVPVTLELTLNEGAEDFAKNFEEGKIITAANGDKFSIVKSERLSIPEAKSDRPASGIRVTAMLDQCSSIAFVRDRAVIKEKATLQEIYTACGAKIRSVDSDFPVPRFTCLVGETPSFQISRVLQESGGVVRWKNRKLQFFRLQDLFRQKPVLALQKLGNKERATEFIERHSIPTFFSLNESGGFTWGNTAKPRIRRFSPFKDEISLKNMGKCLIQTMSSETALNEKICAGDLVTVAGIGDFAVITAAHVFQPGADSGEGTMKELTKLWLGRIQE